MKKSTFFTLSALAVAGAAAYIEKKYNVSGIIREKIAKVKDDYDIKIFDDTDEEISDIENLESSND